MDPRGQGRPDTSRPQPDARELLRRVTARAEGWEPLPDAPNAPEATHGHAGASDVEEPADAPTVQHTAVLPALGAQAPQAPAAPAAPAPVRAAGAAPSPASGPVRRAPAVSRRPGRRTVLAGVAALVVVGLLTWAALALGGHGGAQSAAGKASGASAVPALPAGDSVKAHDTLGDCAAHARGQVERFFVGQNCTSAQRYLATGTVAGRPVLFVASRVEMPSATAAAALKKVVDGDGTGNINDLLREGKGYAGAPRSMPSSGYSSIRSGARLVIAEAGFVDAKGSSSTDPALVAAAAQVAQALVSGGSQG